jgi:hypothetical protein
MEMTRRRRRKLSSIFALSAASVLGLAALPASAKDQTAAGAAQIIDGADKLTGGMVQGAEDVANGVVRATGNIVNGLSPKKGLSDQQKARIAAMNRAARARNMAMIRSRVPSVRKLQELRAWQAANLERTKRQVKAAKNR